MNHKKHDPRILAIDLRVLQLGYAVFEGPKLLLDWGGRTYASSEVAGQRVAALLTLFRPTVVVLRKDRRTGIRNTPAVAAILRSIRHEAAVRSVPIRLLTPEQIRQAFSIFQVQTKEEIASLLATIFIELLWKLPPKRKRWQNEHPRMMVFDAVAVGFAHYLRDGVRIPPTE